MTYLICQIIVCLLIATLIGFLLGWYLRRLRCKKDCDELRGKLDTADSELARLQARLREIEANRDRTQLGNVSQRAASPPTSASALGLTSSVAAPATYDSPSVADVSRGNSQQGYIGYEIEEIEGIGKGFGQRLRNIGISTTGDLLANCATASHSADIARKISLDPDSVRRWVCAADLMRIDTLDKDFAELLVWTDIRSVQQLAAQSASSLTADAAAVNAKEHRSREVPSEAQLSDWIRAAKQLKPLLTD